MLEQLDIGYATALLWLAVILSACAGAYRFRHVAQYFSAKSYDVNLGLYTFQLKYLYSLRNPSGKINLVWTDELGRTYQQMDPRVLVRETLSSSIGRLFNRHPEPTESDFSAAVQKHLGYGWLLVSNAELDLFKITRLVNFCVVHFDIRGRGKLETKE